MIPNAVNGKYYEFNLVPHHFVIIMNSLNAKFAII